MGGYIQMGFKETGWECVDCTNLTQNKDEWQACVSKVFYLQVP